MSLWNDYRRAGELSPGQALSPNAGVVVSLPSRLSGDPDGLPFIPCEIDRMAEDARNPAVAPWVYVDRLENGPARNQDEGLPRPSPFGDAFWRNWTPAISNDRSHGEWRNN